MRVFSCFYGGLSRDSGPVQGGLSSVLSYSKKTNKTKPNIQAIAVGEVLKGLVNYGGSVEGVSIVGFLLRTPRYRARHAKRSAKFSFASFSLSHKENDVAVGQPPTGFYLLGTEVPPKSRKLTTCRSSYFNNQKQNRRVSARRPTYFCPAAKVSKSAFS